MKLTNYEKYQAEIINILSGNIAIDKKTGKPCLCADMNCWDCKLDGKSCWYPSVVRDALMEEVSDDND